MSALFVALLLFASTLAAETRPFTCKAAMYPHVMCEASVFPAEVYWTVYLNDVRADYEKGSVVYLTLPDDIWARIEIHVQGTKTSTSFYGRWHNSKTEFRK